MAEVVRIVETWKIGYVVEDSTPAGIASAVEAALAVSKADWNSKCSEASAALHWGAEEKHILQALKQAQADC